jgi:predicted DNA-binding ribbon-helix-helix protein
MMSTMGHDDLEQVAGYYETHDTSADLERAEYDEAVVSEPMITTSLRLPKPVMDGIRAVAEARRMRATVLMREWIEERLARETDTGEQVVPLSALLAFLVETATDAGGSSRQAS